MRDLASRGHEKREAAPQETWIPPIDRDVGVAAITITAWTSDVVTLLELREQGPAQSPTVEAPDSPSLPTGPDPTPQLTKENFRQTPLRASFLSQRPLGADMLQTA